jgi:hypothetical protein
VREREITTNDTNITYLLTGALSFSLLYYRSSSFFLVDILCKLCNLFIYFKSSSGVISDDSIC